MELRCRKINILNIIFIIAIILFGVSFTMYALLNGNYDEFNICSVSTATEVKAVVECEINEADTNHLITDTVTHVVHQIYKVASSSKVLKLLSNAVISNNFYLQPILFIILIIFCSNLFISLPDDWTLLGQKVRLND
ncbi:MAG: hypothetical protein ACYDEX_22355 [Mobilitalea sp.]